MLKERAGVPCPVQGTWDIHSAARESETIKNFK